MSLVLDLPHILRKCEQVDTGLDLILVFPGLVVTGEAIPSYRYAEALVSEEHADTMEHFKEGVLVDETTSVQQVFLKDAKIYGPGNFVFPIDFWHGNLSQLIGWQVGRTIPNEP